MMAQKLMSDNKDNPFNSRFFQPSDAYSKQQTRPIQGDLTLGNIASYFMPFSKDIGPYEDSPKLDRPGGVNIDFPPIVKDAVSGINKFGQVFRGELSQDEIKQLAFDTSLNVAGGGFLGSKIPGAVPSGSLGIFAGKSAVNFPAKSMLKQTDNSTFLKLNNELEVVRSELRKGRMDLGDEVTNNLQKRQKELIDELDAESFRLTNAKKEELSDLDKFMEKQDFRPGFENPKGRFEASKREFGTGLFKLPDNQYRFEIDDTVATLKNLDDVFINQGEFHEIVANVAGAKNIQLDAMGSLNTFFNSKNAVKLSEILDHKELFDNYPQIKDLKVAFYNDPSTSTYGSFYESINGLNINVGWGKSKLGDDINVNTPEQKEKILDILVHEIQHKVQDIENFARGSNVSDAGARLVDFKTRLRREKYNVSTNFTQHETYQKELSSLRDARYLKELDELVAKDTGYQPRQLFNSSDWYQFGDQISSELSKQLGYTYPKVKGIKRDVWIKGAFGKLRDKALKEMRLNLYKGKGENVDEVLDQNFSLKEIKSQIGKLERKQNKHFIGFLEYKKLNNKIMALEKFEKDGNKLFNGNAYNIYQIILGEIESRAVQARRGKTITTPNLKNKFSDSETFKKTDFPLDQFNEGNMVNPPSYFNLKLDDMVF